MHLQSMTWKDVEALDKTRVWAVLPVGVVEQHGHHLPLGTDALTAVKIVDLATEGIPEAIVLPPVNYGSTVPMRSFPGNITVRSTTLVSVIADICASLERSGFRNLLIVNGHGGHHAIIETGIKAAIEAGVGLTIDYAMTTDPLGDESTRVTQGREWGHACEIETAIALALMPDLVRMEKAQPGRLEGLGEFPYPHRFEWEDWRKTSPTGVLGHPELATKEAGERLVRLMVEGLRAKILRNITAVRCPLDGKEGTNGSMG